MDFDHVEHAVEECYIEVKEKIEDIKRLLDLTPNYKSDR